MCMFTGHVESVSGTQIFARALDGWQARLAPAFRLDDSVWASLEGYDDFGFAVFQLQRGRRTIHPMAFTFPSHERGIFLAGARTATSSSRSEGLRPRDEDHEAEQRDRGREDDRDRRARQPSRTGSVSPPMPRS